MMIMIIMMRMIKIIIIMIMMILREPHSRLDTLPETIWFNWYGINNINSKIMIYIYNLILFFSFLLPFCTIVKCIRSFWRWLCYLHKFWQTFVICKFILVLREAIIREKKLWNYFVNGGEGSDRFHTLYFSNTLQTHFKHT